ncbi:MAG: redoxin domain-containing protein [Candidatus Hydrogenedentes bacterium]|nr:redoxin domain-containing protein [Candidatus Hydrogenedentota bacterium]
MTQTATTMMALGTKAPDFSLQDSYENTISLSDFDQAEALLVMFICNHCPFVKHIRDQLAAIGAEYQERGVGVAAIMSNDVAIQAADNPGVHRV